MKILIVHNRYLQPGGEDTVVEAEAALLASRGHDVHRFDSSNAVLTTLSPARAAVQTLWNAEARTAVAQAAKQHNVDVVHFHNTFPALSPSVYYGVHDRAAVVQTLHNFRLVCPAASLMRKGELCQDCVGSAAWRGVVHKCYRDSHSASLVTALMTSAHRYAGTWSKKVDAYVALTNFTRDVFVRGGLDGDKIFVKPNFVDVARRPDGQGERSGAVFVGRLEEGKGIRVLMNAWRQLPHPVRLKIMGAGVLEEEVRAFAASTEGVEVVGHVTRERVLDEMAAAKMLIAPMLWFENFPLGVCEAMASGCAVISSNSANLAEILDHGQAGVLFERGDAADLARTVVRVDADNSLRARIAEAARKKYENVYTPDANYSALMQIYEHSRTRSARI